MWHSGLGPGVLPLPPEENHAGGLAGGLRKALWKVCRRGWAVGSPWPSITRRADGVLARLQQQIAEEKRPAQTRAYLARCRRAPSRRGPSISQAAAAALRSGLRMPGSSPRPPRPLPACSALGETLLPNTVLGLICAGAGPVIPVTAVHLDDRVIKQNKAVLLG